MADLESLVRSASEAAADLQKLQTEVGKRLPFALVLLSGYPWGTEGERAELFPVVELSLIYQLRARVLLHPRVELKKALIICSCPTQGSCRRAMQSQALLSNDCHLMHACSAYTAQICLVLLAVLEETSQSERMLAREDGDIQGV